MKVLRRGKQELAAGTLTPSILVRIQVPQPANPVSGIRQSTLSTKSMFIGRSAAAVDFGRDDVVD
jgi:hypothetical protein